MIYIPRTTKWLKRESGLITPMTKIEEQADFYLQNYDVISKYVCNHTGGHKEFLDKAVTKPYRCRFCGKSEPEVKFTDDAHAISELIGNKSLFLKSECEACNKKFGRIYEDQFAKYLGPGRTVTQTKGKNGIPSYKTVDGKFRMDVTDKGFVIQEVAGNGRLDFSNGEIQLQLVKDTYIPLNAFKALVFMALSVIPENEVSAFDETIRWLNGEEICFNMKIYSQYVMERFIAGAKPLPLSAVVLRRKYGKEVPYSIFSLEFDNYGFQIVVPCPKEDYRLDGKTITIHALPSMIDIDEELKNRKQSFAIRDWSSNKPLRGESFEMNLHYEYREEITGKYSDVADMAKQEGVKPLKPKG
ncbi:hypothetical protein SAMN02910275_02463 [Butyrivibrio sp. INlla18]|uniref:HNH endonuclease n=1 Tax=Butyrivibrio sp. INlla18 TaxID=1520806 RepID=UPI00088AE974|nr:HNH endonuclease [Butyrivibrio sp. INlla18]SDA73269.1 hypothetical protein SAMN02910275_02463 [Butyrivibrio sp. INlla18]